MKAHSTVRTTEPNFLAASPSRCVKITGIGDRQRPSCKQALYSCPARCDLVCAAHCTAVCDCVLSANICKKSDLHEINMHLRSLRLTECRLPAHTTQQIPTPEIPSSVHQAPRASRPRKPTRLLTASHTGTPRDIARHRLRALVHTSNARRSREGGIARSVGKPPDAVRSHRQRRNGYLELPSASK